VLLDSNQPDELARELVRKAQGGDRAAFEELVKKYYRQIYRWALGITRDPDDADDVVQEVLVRLHKRIESYAGKSQFSTWLFQVTRNTALGQQRKLARRRNLLLGFRRTEHEAEISSDQTMGQLQTSQMVDHVRVLYEALPTRQRQVFDLADLQGFKPSEVGEMLGMNPVTVRANLCKARRAIRAKILERYPEMAEGFIA
jgi:RNA polymerase sigma-70 factor (ECF subfamily)